MGKDRRSVSLDSDLNHQLQNQGINVSNVANRLFREYLNRGDTLQAAVAVRLNEIDHEISDVNQEIAGLESRIEVLRDEREDLKSMQSEFHSSIDEALEEVVSLVEADEWNPEYNDAENPLVKQLAGQAGVTPSRFSEQLETELTERGYLR